MRGKTLTSDQYIIGLDLGNDSSALAFFGMHNGEPEAIDLSGGYGKHSMPTVVQHIPTTGEWVFGEYALLNHGAGVTYDNLINRLGTSDKNVTTALTMLVKEILSNIKNINPRAEIVGIVTSVPDYLSRKAIAELVEVFNKAGYGDKLLEWAPNRECVLTRYFHDNNADGDVLLLDFGASQLRGGLYRRDGITITAVSSMFSDQISMDTINAAVEDFFDGLLPVSTKKEQLSAFAYGQRDILFQKNAGLRPIKFYFNFLHPPQQVTVTPDQITNFISPYKEKFEQFIKSVSSGTPHVLCAGGGFEMLWARDVVSSMFKNVTFYKNPKMANCEGAALIGARILGVYNKVPGFNIVDNHQLPFGIDINNTIPLVSKGDFWWQNHPAKLVLVTEPVKGELELTISKSPLAKTDKQALGTIKLKNLPTRPKSVTRLSIGVHFTSPTEFTVKVEDIGFGELFPTSGASTEIINYVKINHST